MFEERSVFILGAGASAHCDMPLGHALNKQIKSGIAEAVGAGPSHGIWENLAKLPPSSRFLQRPYHFLLMDLHDNHALRQLIGRGPLHKVMNEFSEALASQTNFVIDQFLTENPEFSQIGKLCIAIEIIRATYQYPKAKDRRGIKKDWCVPTNENWYAHFINQLRSGAADARDLEDRTSISIVNFNYERTFEEAIGEQLGRPSRFRGVDYRRCVEFLHPHGCIVHCDHEVADFSALLIKSATGMSVIDEVPDHKEGISVLKQREVARSRIAEASNVYILGFGFHPFNVRMLDLHRTLPKGRTFALNYANNQGLDAIIEGLGIPKTNRWTGEIPELFSQGAFASPGGVYELSPSENRSA
jgi:hypothetical protein